MTRARLARAVTLALVTGVLFTGCRSAQGVLRDLPADAPAAEYTLQIPEGYEVRSVGFGAAYDTSVSGGGFGGGPVSVSGSSSQQPYVHVYAREEATGQEVLLLYGDIRKRAAPIAIIRLERGEALRTAR